jgi:hypothetical protein
MRCLRRIVYVYIHGCGLHVHGCGLHALLLSLCDREREIGHALLGGFGHLPEDSPVLCRESGPMSGGTSVPPIVTVPPRRDLRYVFGYPNKVRHTHGDAG